VASPGGVEWVSVGVDLRSEGVELEPGGVEVGFGHAVQAVDRREPGGWVCVEGWARERWGKHPAASGLCSLEVRLTA